MALLKSNEHHYLRCAIIFLKEISECFPIINSFGTNIELEIKRVIGEVKNNRKDIHALATMYHGTLLQKRSHWMKDENFYQKASGHSKDHGASSASPSATSQTQ